MEGTLGQGHPLQIYDLDTIGYSDALDLQHRLVAARQEATVEDTLLLLEHPPVITQGKSAGDGDIVASEDTLRSTGVELVRIERGGETTYHGPGQLVGYPIIDLRQHLRSLKKYVYLLEEIFITYLKRYHRIEGYRDPEHRGVWVDNEKITAIGVAVQRRVTFHGFAFNVNTNLSHFDWIVPCGITDRGQTSLEKCTGHPQDMAVVKERVGKLFCELFGYRFEAISPKNALPVPNQS